MDYQEIMRDIASGLTGENEKDIQYLMEQMEKYKDHELGKEIIRACGRLISGMLPEDKADELTENKIIENSKNLFDYHGLAWQLGQFSLEFFCMYFLQDIYLPKEDNAAAPLAPVHEELWKDIQESYEL